MPLDSLNGPLYLTFALGAGLMAGGLGLAVRRWDRPGRVGVAITAAAVTTLTAVVIDPTVAPLAGGLAAVPVGLALLSGTRLWSALATLLQRPPAVGAVTAAAGVALIAGGQLWHDQAVKQSQDNDLAQLAASEYRASAMADPVGVTAVTDRGSPVKLAVPAERKPQGEMIASEKVFLNNPEFGVRLIRRSPADDGTNCHGWVFTGGRYWIASAMIETILTENGYAVAPAPAAGDVVIYRNEYGQVMHTAVVRAVADDGTVLAEGKWGAMGVYLHDVSASSYGQRFTFYRSPRGGHLLRGLEPAPAP